MYATLCIFLLVVYTPQSSNPLDIADYTFHFNTHHYDLKTSVQHIALDPNIHLNINLQDLTIDISSNSHHEPILSLDITNDNDWNEISLISSVDNYTKIEYEQYIAIDKALTYNDAQSYCKHHFYGHLASIHTSTDNTVLTQLCQMLPNTNNNNCWIGLKHPFSIWEDHKPSIFTNFNEEYTITDTTSCTGIHTDGLWHTLSCNIPQSFICKRTQLLYRSGYVGVVSRMDYEDANTYCVHKFGTKMADYNDKYTDDIMRTCSDTGNGDWCWINGYNDCMKIKDNGDIADTDNDCAEEHFFLCDRYVDVDVDTMGVNADDDNDDRRRLVDWSDYYYYYVPQQPQQEQQQPPEGESEDEGEFEEEEGAPLESQEEEGAPLESQEEEEGEFEKEEPQQQQKQQQPLTHGHHIAHPHPMAHPMHNAIHPMHPMHPMHHMGMMHPMHHMGMTHPMHHMMHPMNHMMHPMHPMHPMHQMGMMGGMNPMMHGMMGGMGMGMNPMMHGMGGMMGGMGGMGGMMNPMMGGMGGMMGGMGGMMGGGMGGMMGGMGRMGMMGMNPMMMGGVHHVYDIHSGNTQQWRKKMRDMLRMMKDMDMLHSGRGRSGCHHHYGCGSGSGANHKMQHCVFFGTQLVCNMGFPMMPYNPWTPIMTGMSPMGMYGMPPMGGLYPMGSQILPGMHMTNNKKPIVVVHSPNAKVKHRMVDDKTAQNIKNNAVPAGVHRRRMMDSVDVEYVYDEVYMDAMIRCRVLDLGQNVYDICVQYDLNEMMFSLEIKSMDKKEWRRNGNDVFRFDDRYNGVQENVYDDSHLAFGDNYVSFDPIEGHLGFVLYKYELLNGVYGDMQQYDYFDDFVHYFHEFVFVYDDECSARLDGIPFRLCLDVDDDDILLYFERDEAFVNVDIIPDYSLTMQQYIDDELERSSFSFDGDEWDEINRVYIDGQACGMEKCVYLSTSKVCIKKENSDTIKASFKSQLAHKPN